jgi:DNA topoisomerase-1
MKNLVVVESPTKAKTIGRYLGEDYEVIASMGHIYDLPKSTLGVDVEKNFEPQYELMKDKSKTLASIKNASKTADRIIMATDLDREGEAIAYHIAQNLDSKKAIDRIVFHEITKEAIEEALSNPKKINQDLVDAQTARRVLDRLVGYKLSPILWQKVRRGLSAGRVQSVALRLIVEREREIEKFKKEPYYTINVNLKKGSAATAFELLEINKERIEVSKTLNLYDGEYEFSKTSVDSETKAKQIEEDLKSKNFIVSDVTKKEMRRTPPPPYTTSTLQQDGARRMGMSGRRTMQLAQKLYEEGFITYHRTDSVTISSSAKKQMSDFVKAQFGEKYLAKTPRFYKNTSKNAQEAHEAIRPSKVSVTSDQVAKELGGQYEKLYELIWRRAVATQMADAITESTVVMVDASSSSSNSNYTLKANGSVLVFEGFLKINPLALNDNKLPDFSAKEKLDYISSLSEFHETLPPPRYNDASIIKTLEEKGIGRPSTYATIISTIESRAYIEREEGRFKPTSVGLAVNDFLVSNFSTVDDIPFTASMEENLDEIANGTKKWIPVIKEFYDPFEKTLANVKDVARVKIATESTGEKCPECKEGDIVVRTGRFGKFFSCSRFPECKFTRPFVEETGLTCPKDGGKIVIKKTKRGRRFYGCGNYPNCDFASWTKPTPKHVEPRLNLGEIPSENYQREKLEDVKKSKDSASIVEKTPKNS